MSQIASPIKAKNLQRPLRLLGMLVLVLFMQLSIATPARAGGAAAAELMCIQTNAWPGAKAVCKAMASGAISEAVGTAILVFVRSMITRIELTVGLRAREASINADLASTSRELTAETEAEMGTVPGAEFACMTDSSAAILNGQETAQAPPTTPGAPGGPAAGPTGPPPARVQRGVIPRPDLRNTEGNRQAVVTQLSNSAAGAVMARARGEEGEGAALDIKEEAALTAGGCRPCPAGDTECAAQQQAAGQRVCPQPYADVEAMTLFGNDTFLGETEADREAAATAALMYCVNLMAPGAPERASGPPNPDAITRQAVERTGDARTALAVKTCTDAWARRVPLGVPADNPGYALVVSAACAYRNAVRTSLDRQADAARAAGEPVDDLESLSAALSQACDGNASGRRIDLSLLELTRIISSDIFATEEAIAARSGASEADLIRGLLAMETIQASMNMETLRMQELLNLIQAANLAAEVRTR